MESVSARPAIPGWTTASMWNYSIMNWNRECRYKVLGRVANSDQGLCMLFDLEEAIMFTPKPQEYTDPITGEFRCCWKQMVWRQEKTISLKDGMMPRKMQLSFRLKKMNKVPSRLKSVQLDITSTWSYNTSKWT